ncbi:hypothetical protein, partial [Aliibacillus thermotolerans]|uniref:hypothetical protein n=1 Tax=Aliibacillus thermotolerans TaxID=1834418 RepID=UPI0022EAD763
IYYKLLLNSRTIEMANSHPLSEGDSSPPYFVEDGVFSPIMIKKAKNAFFPAPPESVAPKRLLTLFLLSSSSNQVLERFRSWQKPKPSF